MKNHHEKRTLEFTDKTEYITKTLRRTHNKIYENYIITRIWHQLDRLDVEFRTQQYVSRPKGFALVDLYLPQLNMFIEVDETLHLLDINRSHDQIRKEDILSNFNPKTESEIEEESKGKDVINLEEDIPFERISAGVIRGSEIHIDIEKINKQCDQLVRKIRRRIKELSSSFEPWDNKEKSPQTYIEKGKITKADKCAFKTCRDVANCFGHNYKDYRQGITKHPYEEDTKIWFPRLFDCGEWITKISDDGKEIREKNRNRGKNDGFIQDVLNDSRDTRIVFGQGIDALGLVRYRFKGVFKLDKKKTNEEKRAVWIKISDDVRTYPPKKVNTNN